MLMPVVRHASWNLLYAAGDVIGFPSLAATSMVQARLAACHMFDYEYRNQLEYFSYGIYSEFTPD